MRYLTLLFLPLLVSCNEPEPKYNPVESAKIYAKTYCPAPSEIRGPTCFPEDNGSEPIPCSYACVTPGNTDAKVSTIECDIYNHGQCKAGSIPVKTVAHSSVGSTGFNNDWLMWYFLFNSGRTTYVYDSWYRSTPPSQRIYYSPTSTPTREQRKTYQNTIASGGYAPAGATVTTKSYTTASSTQAKSTATSSSSTTSTKSSSSATTTSSTSRGGFGSSGRSAGTSSS